MRAEVPAMKRLILASLFALALGLGPMLTPSPACAAGGCGIKPIKPIPPIGCKDLVAQCRCDSSGQN